MKEVSWGLMQNCSCSCCCVSSHLAVVGISIRIYGDIAGCCAFHCEEVDEV